MTATRQWTGRLWTPSTTIDGREIAEDALFQSIHELHIPIPVRGLRQESDPYLPGEIVGTCTAIVQVRGSGLAMGMATLNPGRYPVAISITEAEFAFRSTDPDGEWPVQIVTHGRLMGIDITRTPAWPQAEIVVHES